MLAIQEIELNSAGAAQDIAKQGRQHLEAKCQKLCSTYSGESPFAPHCFSVLLCLVMNQLFFS